MKYRDDIPQVPDRIRQLPVQRGYPVPWFVQHFEETGYDFRVVDGRKMRRAIRDKLCWICGESLGSTWVFVLGPMCIINQINSEPPSHRECAEFAVRACPFLMQRQVKRNDHNMPDGAVPAAGEHIDRQPGVMALWITNKYTIVPAPGGSGLLFEVGKPSQVIWYREGRTATRSEIMESIISGFPALEEMEMPDTFGMRELHRRKEQAIRLYVPEDDKKFFFGSAAKRD